MRRKLGRGCWEEAGSRKLGGIMEEASWRRAWLARGGLRPGGVSGQKQCVFACVFMVNVNYARGKPTREPPRGHDLSIFITLLATHMAVGESDRSNWPPVTEQGRPFAKALGKTWTGVGIDP